MAEENPRDDMRTIPIHDLVEQIRRVRKRVRAIPSRKHVADDPNALVGVLRGLEFVDEEGECTRGVRAGGIDEIEVVPTVPEVSIQGDDAQAIVVLDGVSRIMSFRLRGGRSINPAVVLPQSGDVVVVPTELLAERTGQRVRGIDGFGVRVVVAEGGEDGPGDVVFEQVESGCLGVFDEGSGELVLRVVSNQVAGVDGPGKGVFPGDTCQGAHGLEGSCAEVVGGVTFVGAV